MAEWVLSLLGVYLGEGIVIISDTKKMMLKKIIDNSYKIECTFEHDGATFTVELEDDAVEYIRELFNQEPEEK